MKVRNKTRNNKSRYLLRKFCYKNKLNYKILFNDIMNRIYMANIAKFLGLNHKSEININDIKYKI